MSRSAHISDGYRLNVEARCKEVLPYYHGLFPLSLLQTIVTRIEKTKFHKVAILAHKKNLSSVSDANRVTPTGGKRIMLETRFTQFPALSVDPREVA